MTYAGKSRTYNHVHKILSEGNPVVRYYPGRLFGPVSKHLSGARSAAQLISRNPRHGVKLLLNSRSEPRIQFQPDVYPFAAYLAERFECTHVIVTGKPTAKDLMELYPQFQIIGIVPVQTWRRAATNTGSRHGWKKT